MVANHDSSVQCLFGHEASGFGGELGASPHEGCAFLVDQFVEPHTGS